MASSKARAHGDIFAIFRSVCHEDQGAFHAAAHAKGSVGIASRGGEMEVEVIGIARGDVDGDGDVVVGVRVATGATDI